MAAGRKNQRTEVAGPRTPTLMDARIGVLIRERRLALELRQEDLAGQLKITQHQLQKYETGANRIAASRLIECARVLEVPVAWFYQSADADGAAVPAAHSTLSVDERDLVERYRKLSAEKKSQLIGISKLLQNGEAKAERKSRRT